MAQKMGQHQVKILHDKNHQLNLINKYGYKLENEKKNQGSIQDRIKEMEEREAYLL